MTKFRRVVRALGLIIAVVAAASTREAQAIMLDSPAVCSNIFGGSWFNEPRPQIGRCVVIASYTLSGNKLDIGAGVTLVMDGSVLTNRSSIFIAETAEIRAVKGAVVNHGKIEVEDGGVLRNDGAGYIYSTGVLENEGTVNIAGGTLYNTGLLQNFDGVIRNDGTVIIYGNGEIRNDSKSQVLNMNGFYVVPPGVLVNRGTLDNKSGAFIKNVGIIRNEDGDLINMGLLENYRDGLIVNENGATVSNGGVLRNEATLNNDGKLENSGRISNGRIFKSAGTLNNYSRGLIENYAGAVITNVSGIFTNVPNAKINNANLISIGCLATFIDNGTVTGNPVQVCVLPPPPFPRPPVLP